MKSLPVRPVTLLIIGVLLVAGIVGTLQLSSMIGTRAGKAAADEFKKSFAETSEEIAAANGRALESAQEILDLLRKKAASTTDPTELAELKAKQDETQTLIDEINGH